MQSSRHVSEVRRAGELPLVAVVTPVYNGGKHLARTMESVQAQTYPRLVHIVLNNASTDNTAEIIASFCGRNVEVLAYANENTLPMTANWAKAFTFLPADTVYAKLLCADDLIRADAIEQLVNAAEVDPSIQAVMSDDVFGDVVRKVNLPEAQSVFDGFAIVQRILTRQIGWLAYHHFFVRVQPEDRRKFIDDYWAPDPHVVIRATLRGKFAYVHEALTYNRAHADSITMKEVRENGVQREMIGLDLLQHFGPDAFADQRDPASAYRGALREFRGTSCRYIVRWKLTGQSIRAQKMIEALAGKGIRFSFIEYVGHVLAWPAAIMGRAPRRRGSEMNEAGFLAASARRAHPPSPVPAGHDELVVRRAAP